MAPTARDLMLGLCAPVSDPTPKVATKAAPKAATPLERMREMAKIESEALKRRTDAPVGAIPVARAFDFEKIERRAKQLCESCGKLVSVAQAVKINGDLICGAEACRRRLKRWSRIKSGGWL